MKAFFAPMLAIAFASGLAGNAIASEKMDHNKGHGAMHAKSAEAPLMEGTVKKVDKAGGKLVVHHGPLPNGMPAMTMTFRLKEAAWFDKLKEGQTIRFAQETIDGAMTIVRLETAG